MITFKKLGSFGRFGNQLFQVAAAVALARRNGDEAIFHRWEYGNRFANQVFQSDKVRVDHIWKEPSFTFTEIPYRMNLSLEGYFQSERYFADCADEIRRIFKPSDDITAYLDENHAGLSEVTTCSIHVRRTDYLRLSQYHTPQSMRYYRPAMKMIQDFEPDVLFVIFSDDIGWCRKQFKSNSAFRFIEDEDDEVDFFLMTRCDHHIIANSSFSWWGAWLNDKTGKLVVAPSKWFGYAASHKTDDLYAKGWMII